MLKNLLKPGVRMLGLNALFGKPNALQANQYHKMVTFMGGGGRMAGLRGETMYEVVGFAP